MSKLRSIKIPYDSKAILLERINRFLAKVRLQKDSRDLGDVYAHVRDPGRLEDLLFPGNELLIQHKEGKNRKTEWEVVFAKKGTSWVLVNSGYHRKIGEWSLKHLKLFTSPIRKVIPEKKLGKSRIDFLVELEDHAFIAIETKGCTLAVDHKALFPDAPTKRGARHVSELIQFVQRGNKAAILFFVFRTDADCFYANARIDPSFAAVFEQARTYGVQIIPLQFDYDENEKVLFFKQELGLCKNLNDNNAETL